jgi:deazaflavin-dependent oxidoreductase (nitroreductase family)
MGREAGCVTLPAVPVRLSRRVARFNRAVGNPIQLTYAWLLPPWAVIEHRGRVSGRPYRTPVNAYRRGSVFAVVVLYGPESDWVRNLLAAGGGGVVRGGRHYALTQPRVVAVASGDPVLRRVSPVARLLGRVSGFLLVGELTPAPAN